MTTCTHTQQLGITWLTIDGRIDSMSSTEVQQEFDELILSGSRLIVVNLEQVNFISSAGLRVFLAAQKQLTQVGGEIILFKTRESVLRIFTMTGFEKICKIISTEAELSAACAIAMDSTEMLVTTVDGVTFKRREMEKVEPGVIRMIGSQDKLAGADYAQDDVVTVSQAELPFGVGLATVGERYEEYKNLFGEALIINKHFYFYPAVKRPTVDYMFYSGKDAGAECRFLHGFCFDGPYRYLVAFESATAYITLDQLLQWVWSLSWATPLLGIVLLAESKGLFGMNLKQIPLQENKPTMGDDIFAVSQVASWINFPVDPVDPNHMVAGAGLLCRNKASCTAEVQKLFSSESRAHIHAGIFAKGPISKNLDQFSAELDRVLTKVDVLKVQHLLGQSRFSNGMLGLIELKG